MPKWIRSDFKVRFQEVDQFEVVWYGHYFGYFELVRYEILSKFDLLPHQLMELGFSSPVIHAECDYKAPARFNEELYVLGRAVKEDSAKLIFQFHIKRKKDDFLLAKGMTIQVLLREGLLVYKLRSPMKERVEALVDYFR